MNSYGIATDVVSKDVSVAERYARVYCSSTIGIVGKKLINAMRQETSRNIILYLAVHLNASQAELSRELDVSPTAISRHLKRLVELDLIEPATIGKGVVYTAHKNPTIIQRNILGREVIYRLTRIKNTDMHMDALLCRFLNHYKKSLVDDTVKSILEYLSLVNPKSKLPKKTKHILN